MGDPFQHVSRGDKIPTAAETINGWQDAARMARTRGMKPLGSSPAKSSTFPHVVINAWNATGASATIGTIGRISAEPGVDPAVDPYSALTDPMFGLAAFGVAANQIGIFTEPVPYPGMGRAVICGHAVCTVEILHVDHWFAEYTGSTTKLRSAPGGPVRIMYKPAAMTGDQVCLVFLQPNMPIADEYLDDDTYRYSVGMVNSGTQSWAGRKFFRNGIQAQAAGETFSDYSFVVMTATVPEDPDLRIPRIMASQRIDGVASATIDQIAVVNPGSLPSVTVVGLYTPDGFGGDNYAAGFRVSSEDSYFFVGHAGDEYIGGTGAPGGMTFKGGLWIEGAPDTPASIDGGEW